MGGITATGVGAIVVGWGLRHAIPTLPKWAGYAIVLAGISAILTDIPELIPMTYKPPLATVAFAIAGVVCLVLAAHFYISRSVAAPQSREKEPPSPTIHVYNAPVTQVVQAKPETKMAQMNDRNSGAQINIQNAPGSIINPSGGQNTITNNFGPQPRNLDSPWGTPLKAQILKELPRDKTITVSAVLGDAEGIQLAHQIYTFLKTNNFKLEGDGISQSVFSQPIKGLIVQPAGEGKLSFIVGANLP